MKIASHHIPGTAEHDLSKILGRDPEYQPTCAWPEDCTVQWGHGIVPQTPFFEAFPKGTFIRGEGKTIADAEKDAFDQYQRDMACEHVWGRYRPGRQTYLNGAAFCRKCDGFRGSMFPEIQSFGWWRKPLTNMEVHHLKSLEDQEMTEIMNRKYPQYKERRRKSERILRLRFSLYGSCASGE